MGERKRRLAVGHARSEQHVRLIGHLLHEAQQLQRAGRLREAQAAFERVVDLDASNAEAWLGLGKLALRSRALPAALALLTKAAEFAPERADVCLQYAYALQEAGQFDSAAVQLLYACRLQPDVAQYWEDLGIVQQALGETAAAAHAYDRACALQPTLARRLKRATLVSPIAASRESIATERSQMEAAMGALLEAGPDESADPMQMALWPNFYWAFHGLDDRALQIKAAAMYRHLFPSLAHVAAHCRSSRRRSGRIRVGLISQFFHNHSIGRTSRGLFACLSRDRFEVTALFIAPAVDDHFSRFIRHHAEHSVDVPRELPAARRLIETLELDILFYQDIGMEPFGYFLAFSRLAPVQCVSFGHPDTTGIPTIDYFVSGELYETPEAQAHYSERLFLLRDVGSLAYYYRPERPLPRKDRSHFGLTEREHVYLCPQNLFKIHPDIDKLLAGVLRRDAAGRLVAINAKIEHWTELLRRRWQARMPDVMDRIVFLPRMDSADYVNLIEVADVMLDTLHFNGMNTSLEAFCVGTPVVTWPGEFQRGRHTQAMYRRMGLADHVADGASAYVDQALRLGTDSAYRNARKAEILERSDVLFEDPRVVREFERFFATALDERLAAAADSP